MSYRLFLASILLVSLNVRAASFECDQELSQVEKMICSDIEASSLDHELSKTYARKMRRAEGKGKDILIQSQRNWLKNMRNQCVDITCIKNSYMVRLYQLYNFSKNYRRFYLSYNGSLHNVIELFDTDKRIGSFNKSGAALEQAEIVECDSLVEISVGTAHGNKSYGGLCTLRKNEELISVIVCDDNMAGHYRIESVTETVSRNDLALFVVKHCYGG